MSFGFGPEIIESVRLCRQVMSKTQTTHAERRLSRRAKLAKMLRVRPSDPRDKHFEDLPVSMNASNHSVYFHTNRTDYYKGMRLFVTFPYTFVNDPMNEEYLAAVVRVEKLVGNRLGVALHLLTTV